MAKPEQTVQFDVKYLGSDDFHDMGILIVGTDYDWAITEKNNEFLGTFFYEIKVYLPWVARGERYLAKDRQAAKGQESVQITGKGMLVAPNEKGLQHWKDVLMDWTSGMVEFVKPTNILSPSHHQIDVEFTNEYKMKSGKELEYPEDWDISGKQAEEGPPPGFKGGNPFYVTLSAKQGFEAALKEKMSKLVRTDFSAEGLRQLGFSDEQFVSMVALDELTHAYERFATKQEQEKKAVEQYEADVKAEEEEMKDIEKIGKGGGEEEEREPTPEELSAIEAEEEPVAKEAKIAVCPHCGGKGCPSCEGEGIIDKPTRDPEKRMRDERPLVDYPQRRQAAGCPLRRGLGVEDRRKDGPNIAEGGLRRLRREYN